MNDRPIIPEVLPPEREIPPDLIALDTLARMLDEAVEIPGTGKKVGLDAATGLLPGVGDLIGTMLSASIIVGALRHRVPGRRIARMIANVLIDTGLGTLPLIGDLFDALYHQNTGNMRILLDYRNTSEPPRTWREIGWISLLVLALLLGVSLAVTIGTILLILKVASLIGGA